MPFSLDYHWEIMRILDVPFEQESDIKNLLTAVEHRSETWVGQVIKLVEQIKDFENKVADAAAGLTKVDVIEWKPDRYCSAENYLSILKKQLARTIGYKMAPPFNNFESNTDEVSYGDWCANKLRCNNLFRPHSWW